MKQNSDHDKIVAMEQNLNNLGMKVEELKKNLTTGLENLSEKVDGILKYIDNAYNSHLTVSKEMFAPKEVEKEVSTLKTEIDDIKGDRRWVVRVVIEAVIVTALAALFAFSRL